MNIILITGCLAGVAHSKMAAAAVKKEAEARGCQIFIEEQGGHKKTKKLTAEQIDSADVVIIASAIAISGRNRFKGKTIVEQDIGRALRDPSGTLDKAAAALNR